MPDTDKPINLRKVPEAVRGPLRVHAAQQNIRGGLTGYIRQVLAEKAVWLTKPAAPSHRFEFVTSGLSQAQLEKLWADIIDAIEQAGGQLGGGYADEPPNT